MVKKEEYHMLQYSRSGAGLLNHLPFETNRWTRSTTIRALCLSIYRLACFLQNQRAIAVFGLSSTTTNLCCSATSPHLTHLWYIVNHYHPRIFDPMICLSSIMSRYFLSILNGNHVMSHTFYYYIKWSQKHSIFINCIASQVLLHCFVD
jgi:hypothetical protein